MARNPSAAPTARVPGASGDRACSSEVGGKRLRADAARNRRALLDAATEVFSAEGSEAGLEGIAKRAGVGIGTLYRNFPTRQDLLEAVYLDRAVELRRQADDLLGQSSDDPATDLIDWLRAQMAYGRQGRSLGSTVLAAKHQEGTEINTACAAMRDAGDGLLKRAQEAGAVDPKVELLDILKMVHGIVMVTETMDEGRDEQARRMLDLVLAGLVAGGPAPR